MAETHPTPRLEDLAFPPAAEHLDVVILLKQAQSQGNTPRFRDTLPAFEGDEESASTVLLDLEDWGFVAPSYGAEDQAEDVGDAYLDEPIVFTTAGAALVEQIVISVDEQGQRHVTFAGSDGTRYTIVTSADGSTSASFIDEP